jgi:hypothetical protein
MPELTEDEMHYFESGGDVKESLTKEPTDAPPPKPDEAPTAEVPASPPTAPEAPAEVAEADDADDEPEAPAEPGKRGRRVSRKEFDSERAARLAAEKQYNDAQVRNARVEERLNLLQQAIAPQPEAPAPVEAPDPEKDIFAYTRYLADQLNAVTSKVSDYEARITAGQQEMDNERRYFQAMNDFAGTKADFVPAYNYLLRSRAAELTSRSYQVTPEQIQGIMDGRVRVPQEIADALRLEERDLYRSAFAAGQDPAAQIYQYATMRGYRAPAAAPAAPAGTPGTPLGGAPAARQVAPSGQQTATDVISSIQRGQPAAASLSKAGGGPTDSELTPQALADMSEERFAEILNELQQRGEKGKMELQRLFGA